MINSLPVLYFTIGKYEKRDVVASMKDWYQQEESVVVQDLHTDASKGLSTGEAKRRLVELGPNELVERDIKSPLRIFWEQLAAVMVLILIVAAIVSMFLREWDDATVILAIVVLNAVLGFSQEFRAEKAIAALKKMAVPIVRVRRDGEVKEISATELVPGDVMLLEAGNKVSADGRLIECVNLQAQEAALTGESEAVEKSTELVATYDLPLGDRLNMVFMGTIITYGRGAAIVTETGMDTELGNIAEMLQSVEREPTPLQQRLDRLGKTLAWVTLAIIGIVFALGVLRDEDIKLMLLTGISMAVAAIPEGLPAVVTITLALGSRRMLRRHALIRKLPAVETLGSVTTICSDKTGTLTENRMTVTVLDVAGEKQDIDTLLDEGVAILDAEFDSSVQTPRRGLSLLLRAAALCNDATLQPVKAGRKGLRAIGDPTESALVVAAAQLGLIKPELEERLPRVAEVPFTSERKRMMTIHQVTSVPDPSLAPWHEAPFVAFIKGAVDSLLEITDSVWTGSNFVPLDEKMIDRINESNEGLADAGQRVLGVAFRPVDDKPLAGHEEELERNLTFIGLIGMLDPPRPEVKEAVSTCRSAGIRPIMITGDHPLTARHIANELGISTNGHILTGMDLTTMPKEDLRDSLEDVSVFARVSPEQKLDIVRILQEKGEVVAMTGDGVNDAPALKKADIGVAMGITGTDVSKEASDMVLLDDNFATIVSAIEEGRVIYDNIRKFIKYILSSNTGEIWVMLLAPFLGMPLPLLPLQILWINLVTDGLPGLALAVEPAEKGTMSRPPFKPGESVFSQGIGLQIIWIGIVMGAVSLGVGLVAYVAQGSTLGGTWRTMIFTTLTLAQMGNALATRSKRDSLFTIGITSNRVMLGAVLLTFILQLAVIYLPFLQRLFKTEALSGYELLICLVMSTVVFWATELEKWFLRRKERNVPFRKA
ncbi:MAG: cation-translocating P-type ATPase [Candidatus Promineifilaceae bacterium]